jgi:hypothetical protein
MEFPTSIERNVRIYFDTEESLTMAVSEQPMRKLLGVLSPTIFWLSEQGSVAISAVPASHLEAIKQLERIGIVYKRNNRSYELQKIRLKKLLGNATLESLLPQESLDPVIDPNLKATLN